MIELLLSLILAMTGIARDVDPQLTAIAQQRAIEASVDFSHTGQVSWTAEVLAWNEQPTLEEATRRAAQQWRDSPDHWAILTDRSLTRIGCGHHQVGSRHTFACVLAYPSQSAEPVEAVRSPKPTPVGSTPTSGATPAPAADTGIDKPASPTPSPMMPDTAMFYSSGQSHSIGRHILGDSDQVEAPDGAPALTQALQMALEELPWVEYAAIEEGVNSLDVMLTDGESYYLDITPNLS